MTKRLILIRHAKSSWDDAEMPDHDRPLNPRGRGAASEIGAWLASRGYLPDEAIVSDARRTVETWERIAEALPGAPEPRQERKLYQAAADTMLAVLRHATGDCVLMLGHNPGIAEFAQRLVARPPLHSEFQRYPTGATLVAEFPIDDWSEAAWSSAAPDDFIIPRELDG
ncbi:SixA phosphatase family protein [Solirhodobacter olei]|uniref:SixA phosphatase family protein n=1 Tax=Solirhodobacter olei TaxID=2493082 RepID=UPI000FDC8420|nr:histidine phosphatase family protein [Solirhodobacter olei]